LAWNTTARGAFGHPPLRLGQIQVVRVLQGGMGLVYLCVQPDHGDAEVAIKRPFPQLCTDDAVIAAFREECTLWMRLGEHPNVVRARRVHYSPPEPPLLVMDYLPQSLRQVMIGPLAIPTVLTVALGVVRGLAFARERIPGFFHADLKPENVLLDAGNVAKISDLGLAQVLAPGASPGRTRRRQEFPRPGCTCGSGRCPRRSTR